MLIHCPACQATAEIPASKEGAKVRCGECQRIYVARPRGSRGSSKSGSDGLKMALIFGVLLIIGVSYYVFNKASNQVTAPPAAMPEVVKQEAPAIDLDGWESKPVMLVRGFYTAIADYDEERLKKMLAVEEHWAWKENLVGEALAMAAKAEAGEPGDAENSDAESAEGGDAEPSESSEADAVVSSYVPVEATDYYGMEDWQRVDALKAMASNLVNDESADAPRQWKPFDGSVIEEGEDRATVHVRVDPSGSDAAISSRTIAFTLLKKKSEWKIERYERFFEPNEKRAIKRKPKNVEKVELTDGSVVYEADPKPLGHLDDTPAELRAKIDKLYATMIDLNLTTEASRARDEMVEIGRPAIPILLTGLYEIPLESMDEAIQVNAIVIALRDITGEYHGYKPMELAGSTSGTTRERRESAIKQWFAWWFIKGKKFQEAAESKDLLEDLIELNDREKKLLERDQRSGG